MNRTYILDGGLACENPFPVFSESQGYRLEGRYMPKGRQQRNSRPEERAVVLSEELLTHGLLFLGSAGAGKTNVMFRLASQVLQEIGDGDIIVMLDVKGDYHEAFFVEGDLVLDPVNDTYCWNIFDDLLAYRDDEKLFDMKVQEMSSYLFFGRESSSEPYFVNAARDVTACILKYFIYEAEEVGSNQNLNNLALKNFIRGIGYKNREDTYDAYRYVLSLYEEFRGALSYIPPKDFNDKSAYGVISEIVNMAKDMFCGAFGSVCPEENVISAKALFEAKRGKVLFVEYNASLNQSMTYVMRLILDWILAAAANPGTKFRRAYFFLDELAILPKLQYLDRALNFLRGKRVCVIGGLQNTAQMYVSYEKAKADAILDAFQSLIVFHSETESIAYVKKRFGNVLVQREYIASGGNIGVTAPEMVSTVESYEVSSLETGMAFLKLREERPFRFQFHQYVPDGR